MARFSEEKAAIFSARALITREIMRSRDAQCNTRGKNLSLFHVRVSGSLGGLEIRVFKFSIHMYLLSFFYIIRNFKCRNDIIKPTPN